MGRAVVILGVPYAGPERSSIARAAYLQAAHDIQLDQWVRHDAAVAVAQCIGRLVRNKRDFGIAVLGDSRFVRLQQVLPLWLR